MFVPGKGIAAGNSVFRNRVAIPVFLAANQERCRCKQQHGQSNHHFNAAEYTITTELRIQFAGKPAQIFLEQLKLSKVLEHEIKAIFNGTPLFLIRCTKMFRIH